MAFRGVSPLKIYLGGKTSTIQVVDEMAKDSDRGMISVEKLNEKDVKIIAVNMAVQEVLKAYLEYTKSVVDMAMTKTGYDAQKFRDIGDELIITPTELVDLINKLQVAFSDL
jgi:hypothetical protein